MKLAATLLACGAFADERAFANGAAFMGESAQQEPFWSKSWFNHLDYWNNIKANGVEPLKAAFDAAAAENDASPVALRSARKFTRDMDKLIGTIESWDMRCGKLQGNTRRRRSDERGLFDYSANSLDKNIKTMFWEFAKYARNQLWECRDELPMFQLYKRLDRFRWIYFRNYCKVINADADFCSWATTAKNGTPFHGPFVQMTWFDNKYGIDAEFQPIAEE